MAPHSVVAPRLFTTGCALAPPCHASSCLKRLSAALQAHLLEPVLSLAYDPVANVRLHLAAAMPALKQAVALPDDVHLLERLNGAMSHLITDGDLDVCQAARKASRGP